MSTRSRIAITTKEGFRSIYCHSDGYPAHNGTILLEHYQAEPKIRQLIALGDISYLNLEIGTKHPFDCPWSDPVGRADYLEKYGDMVLAYGRDRGEEDVKPIDSPDFASLVRAALDSDGEWLYLWTGKAWRFAKVRANLTRPRLKPLTPSSIVKSHS